MTIIGARSVIAPPHRYRVGTAQVVQYLARRVSARRGHDTATWMVSRATQIQSAHRTAVLFIAGERPVEKELVEGQFALKDVAFSQPHLGLKFPRCAHFGMQYQAAKIRTVAGNLIEDGLLECL